MRHAKRKPTKRSSKNSRSSGSGIGMLFTGMFIGCILTLLFIGYKQDPKHGFGSGINQMIENSKRTSHVKSKSEPITRSIETNKSSPNFDFYTILPEHKTVTIEEIPPISKPHKQPKAILEDNIYLLQAGSFEKRDDADSLKAKLALSGYQSFIQKVTLDGKRYYRVRLGPYRNLKKLNKVNRDLSKKGIKALKFKVSQG